MKRIALSLIASMLFCTGTDVQADEYMASNEFYAEAFGGANFLQTEKSGGIVSDYNTGYVVSGSLGYRWCYGLRVEGEYAYRRNSVRKLHFFGRSFSFHGHFQSSSYMANLLWDLPLSRWGCGCWKFRTFIGGGIGYDLQQIHAKNEGIAFRNNKKHFAWQVIAGIGYPLFCSTDISLEYKYHKGGFSYIHNHSLGVGLTYKFGCPFSSSP